jgi:hypothetical protein
MFWETQKLTNRIYKNEVSYVIVPMEICAGNGNLGLQDSVYGLGLV